jgi:protein-S-isoprenylcysteine O-methyltransferase Ste14
MNAYEPRTPRVTVGIVAAVVTAITLGLFAVLPAQTSMPHTAILVTLVVICAIGALLMRRGRQRWRRRRVP